MARTQLRPEIADARSSARFSLGSSRELARLEDLLSDGQTVRAMAQCRYQGCFGLAVLTDARLLVVCEGIIWKVCDGFPLDRIDFVQWQTTLGCGTLTVHTGGSRLLLTGIFGPGGVDVVRGIREHLAGQDRLERRTREGLLAMAAHFAPVPAPVDASVGYFPADSAARPRPWASEGPVRECAGAGHVSTDARR